MGIYDKRLMADGVFSAGNRVALHQGVGDQLLACDLQAVTTLGPARK